MVGSDSGDEEAGLLHKLIELVFFQFDRLDVCCLSTLLDFASPVLTASEHSTKLNQASWSDPRLLISSYLAVDDLALVA